MALLFADSFDHYGSGNAGQGRFSADGAYSETSTNFTPSATIPARTGPYCLRSSTTSYMFLSRPIGGSHATVGFGFGIYYENLANYCGVMLSGNPNTALIAVTVTADGSIRVVRNTTSRQLFGAGEIIASTPAGLITAGSWNHIELKATIDPSIGGFELRLNGDTVLAMSNINLGVTLATRVTITTGASGVGFDDLVVWHTTGVAPRDFIGPARVITTYPASDTPVADFDKVGAADGYACINQPVQDGDTTYIEGLNISDVSEFGIGALPPETEGIAGVYVPTLAKLSAAGVGNLKVSMISDTDEAVGYNGPLTQAYTYRYSAFGVNPETNTPWNKATLEAARLRFEKTA